MRASLLIASHNEGQNLWKTVQSCLDATEGLDVEVVVADDASTDGSIAELGRFLQVRVVGHSERLGVSPTKDLAGRNSAGDVLVFLDGHCKPEPRAIARLIADVEATGNKGIVIPAYCALDVERFENYLYQVGHGCRIDLERFDCEWMPPGELLASLETPWMCESPSLMGCVLAVSRIAYERLRGFDPDMRFYGSEDTDFGLKAWLMGHPILLDPAAVVGHRFRSSGSLDTAPVEHQIANQLRMARKNFTEPVWQAWIERSRDRHPARLWEQAWLAFEERRASVEEERNYLMANRVRDEFWYAARFGLDLPGEAAEVKSPEWVI